jgi:hypothetical protein
MFASFIPDLLDQLGSAACLSYVYAATTSSSSGFTRSTLDRTGAASEPALRWTQRS